MVASKGFLRNLEDMIRRYNIDCLGLLEPKVSGQHTYEISIKKIDFQIWIRVESVGCNEAYGYFKQQKLLLI